jgi:hypothetical protein
MNPQGTGQMEREQTTMIDTKVELEAAILARNQKHFAKAQGTPFTIPPLAAMGSNSQFGNTTDSSTQAIELPPGAFRETATVMEVLAEATNTPPPQWSDKINFEAFIKGLLRWRETTSTSPSGRHLGTYKALLTVYIDAGKSTRTRWTKTTDYFGEGKGRETQP